MRIRMYRLDIWIGTFVPLLWFMGRQSAAWRRYGVRAICGFKGFALWIDELHLGALLQNPWSSIRLIL